MDNKQVLAAAFTAALLMPMAASAQAPVPEPTFKAEKCFGLAKAGKNDCASTGNNSCGGSSRRDADAKAWIYTPAGTCARIVGGSLTPKA